MMKKLVLTGLLLFTPLLALSQSQTITLEEAIDIALENNYQLKQAQNNLNLAETQVFSAKADFFPSVNASMSGTRRIGQQFEQTTVQFVDITTNAISGQISGNIDIFRGFRNINNLRNSRDNVKEQELNETRLREDVMFNTASRYLQVILNKELLIIAEETLEASRSQLRQIEAQVEVGSLPTVDLFNQQSTVANDELEVIRRQNAVDISITQLARIMQVEAENFEFLPPDQELAGFTQRDLNLEEMIGTALSSRNDLKAQDLLIEQNRRTIQMSKADLLPTLTGQLGVNASYNDQFRGIEPDPSEPSGFRRVPVSFSDQFFDQNINRFFGLNLQIPIFNNWNRMTNIQSSEITYKNSRLQRENLEFQVIEEVRQAYNDYNSIIKELESSEVALQAAERAFETEQQRYNVGATTLIELNQANANFVTAQSNNVQAIYNFIFQEKLLDYYLGQLANQFNN